MPYEKAQVGSTDTSTGHDTVSFKSKTDSEGNVTDTLVSRGETMSDDHAHAWNQNSGEPGHRNDSTGVLNDEGDASKSPRTSATNSSSESDDSSSSESSDSSSGESGDSSEGSDGADGDSGGE